MAPNGDSPGVQLVVDTGQSETLQPRRSRRARAPKAFVVAARGIGPPRVRRQKDAGIIVEIVAAHYPVGACRQICAITAVKLERRGPIKIPLPHVADQVELTPPSRSQC